MKPISLTRDLCFAIGWDAAYRQMRKAGRTTWNLEDRNEAARVTNYHLAFLREPWHVQAMLADGMIEATHPALKPR